MSTSLILFLIYWVWQAGSSRGVKPTHGAPSIESCPLSALSALIRTTFQPQSTRFNGSSTTYHTRDLRSFEIRFERKFPIRRSLYHTSHGHGVIIHQCPPTR